MSIIPPVRLLEPVPVQSDEQQLVVLRDPFHFIDEDITVTVPVYLLMTLIDGTRDLAQLSKDYASQFGPELAEAELQTLIQDLDDAGLLETENFVARRERIIADFRDSGMREAAHAGSAYPAQPDELAATLKAWLDSVQTEEAPCRPAAIIAPHIDPTEGGLCSAQAFHALKNAPEPLPDLFVVFGTAHQPTESRFILTEKTFRTPLGEVAVDRDVAAALNTECPQDLLRDEYLHKHEHSIEFQIIFLQQIYKERGQSFKILPILVGSFHDYIKNNTLPSEAEDTRVFIDSIQRALQAVERRICYVAGADLSHMGKKFGDTEGANERIVNATRHADLEMLAHVIRGDAEPFFRQIQSTSDSQKVCGLPPVYTMLSLLDNATDGQVRGYDIYQEPATESCVSYAGVVFPSH